MIFKEILCDEIIEGTIERKFVKELIEKKWEQTGANLFLITVRTKAEPRDEEFIERCFASFLVSETFIGYSIFFASFMPHTDPGLVSRWIKHKNGCRYLSKTFKQTLTYKTFMLSFSEHIDDRALINEWDKITGHCKKCVTWPHPTGKIKKIEEKKKDFWPTFSHMKYDYDTLVALRVKKGYDDIQQD